MTNPTPSAPAEGATITDAMIEAGAKALEHFALHNQTSLYDAFFRDYTDKELHDMRHQEQRSQALAVINAALAAAPRPAEEAETVLSDRSGHHGEPPPAIVTAADTMTVRIDAAGAAHLLALDDGGGCGITVPKERRREIAEKLMGTEWALVRRVQPGL